MASLEQLSKRYRTPLIVALGGVVAYTAYTRTRASQAAAAVAATATAAPGAGSPLSPEQMAALIAQGGALVGQGQSVGAGLAAGGLDLAGLLGTGAQGLAAVLANSQAGLAGVLGNVAGQAIGVLPNFSPPGGIQPQPTSLPPQPFGGPGPPVPRPGPPVPLPGPAPVLIGYRALFGPGTVVIWSTAAGGASRATSWPRQSTAPVVPASGVWRITAGGYPGWWLLRGRSGAFSVQAVYRDAHGVLTYHAVPS